MFEDHKMIFNIICFYIIAHPYSNHIQTLMWLRWSSATGIRQMVNLIQSEAKNVNNQKGFFYFYF